MMNIQLPEKTLVRHGWDQTTYCRIIEPHFSTCKNYFFGYTIANGIAQECPEQVIAILKETHHYVAMLTRKIIEGVGFYHREIHGLIKAPFYRTGNGIEFIVKGTVGK